MSDVTDPPAAGDPLAVMVRSYLDDAEIGLQPDDSKAEIQANTWQYGLPAAGFDVGAVATAFEHVAAQLSKRQNCRPGTFYLWYDVQAGQLRCSLTSRPADRLPFGARHRPTADVGEVLQLAVSDPHPGVVLWEELTNAQDAAEWPLEPPAPFPVWAVTLV